jgi:hypothetical protein
LYLETIIVIQHCYVESIGAVDEVGGFGAVEEIGGF